MNFSFTSRSRKHPTDILALKMLTDTYFFLGKQKQLRDCVARVLPIWTSKSLPLQSYLHGMYAFGLVETNSYAKAAIEASKVCIPYIAINKHRLHSSFQMFRVSNMNREMVGQLMHSLMFTKWKDALMKVYRICQAP